MDDYKNLPFSKGYVLRVTMKNVRASLDLSISKTFKRIAEFDGDQEKSREIFSTLTLLHAMRNNLEEFQQSHKAEFSGQ